MTWLGGWLRELILVVLMAAFVEMLLPSKSMERYARLVLSLLVLLTMLSPIVSLLKGDAAEKLNLAMVQQEQSGGLLSGAGQGTESLKKILADGRQLAAGAQEQSLQLAAEEVAGQMREQIAGSTGIQGVKVTVKLGMGEASSGLSSEAVPVITAVEVTVPVSAGAGQNSAAGADSAAAAGSAPITVQPVEPVQVNLGGGDKGSGNLSGEPVEASSGQAGDAGAAGGETADADAIIKLLESNWNLERDLIQVACGNGDPEKS